MKKLKLDLEELAVEQFSAEVSTEEQGPGSVQGYDASKWWSGCGAYTCLC